MTRLFSLLFLGIFTVSGWSQQASFVGRIDLGRDLASFDTNPPVPGTLYLLAGSATVVRVLSQDPFLAEVEFVQGEWVNDDALVAHKIVLTFEGAAWSQRVATKKPRKDSGSVVYPYRQFQVAAVVTPGGFRVVDVPLFF